MAPTPNQRNRARKVLANVQKLQAEQKRLLNAQRASAANYKAKTANLRRRQLLVKKKKPPVRGASASASARRTKTPSPKRSASARRTKTPSPKRCGSARSPNKSCSTCNMMNNLWHRQMV